VLGIFGLSIRTTERDLDDEFSQYGRVEKVVIVYDQRVSYTDAFLAFHLLKSYRPSPLVLVVLDS
jgi:RNA recognition motif-containing protein